MGTSQAAKAASHDHILDIAAARIRRDGIDRLAVAELMKEAGLTHGGFYRHSDDENISSPRPRSGPEPGQRMDDRVRQARRAAGIHQAHRRLPQHLASRSSRVRLRRGRRRRDAARAGGPARGSYTRQVKECLAALADLTGNPDRQAGEREAILTLSALVGAISIARAVDDPDLSQQILANVAAALKERIPEPSRIASPRGSPANTELGRREESL